jgi:hypothetical protein
VHILAERLDHLKGFGPINMGEMLDLAAELRWAADEASRIDQRKAVA